MSYIAPEYMDLKTDINVINTNARSLRPKMKSFITCFMNLALTFAVVTETWLAQGTRMESDAENLLLGEGLEINYLNRLPSVNGVAHGGVAIITRASTTKIKSVAFPNPDSFEILSVCASVATIKRNFYIIAAYIPPNYTVARGNACLQHINDLILHIKRTTHDPYLLLAGDFNQWDVNTAIQDYVELVEVATPPTREDRKIDRIFTNWSDSVTDSGCLPPLETEGNKESRTYSDHKIQYMCSRLDKKAPIKWETFKHRPFNDRGADAFVEEISTIDWTPVYTEGDTNGMAKAYQNIVDELMDKHFPVKYTKRKEDDLPWLNDVAMKMIKKKKAIYKAEGKTDRWEAHCIKTEEYIENRRQCYLQRQRDKFSGPDAVKHFFKNVKAFRSADKPKDFDIRELRPGLTDGEIATEAAAYFNRISKEFQPLEPGQIPATYHRDLPRLSPADVSELLLQARKPSSMVEGDIFPKLVNRCASFIAWPLSAIYNSILETYIWPTYWKREFVTIIPKKSLPSDFSDLRNISCTLFISKIFEKFTLKCIKEEIVLKNNQYGGVSGCSTTHMIVDILQQICENAEDYRTSTVLCAIDYSKAFNRLSYQHCLDAFRRKGSSTPILKLIATFLTNRTMSVRVGQCWSDPLPVDGGCPQGSILGIQLFNTTTDDLEDDFVRLETERLGIRNVGEVIQVQEEEIMPRFPAEPTCSSPVHEQHELEDPQLSPVLPLPSGNEVRRPRVRAVPVPQPVLYDIPEETKVGTQVLTKKMVLFFKYVDDNISCEKLNFGDTQAVMVNGVMTKVKQALGTQNGFRSVTGKAKERGMVVNESKTNLLCISDAMNYVPATYILDSENNRIDSTDSVKILGFHFSSRPTVNLHVDMVIKKFKQRYWVLNHLRKIGFTLEELVKVYCSSILPIADYCCPAYHSMLTDLQDQLLERVQVGALRAIYGYGPTATELRATAGVTTLRERRIALTDKFAYKCLSSDRFKHWFPLTEGRRTGRNKEPYKEFFAKNDRLLNSPLFYMRRRLNGKPGKTYGERNRRYRENFDV